MGESPSLPTASTLDRMQQLYDDGLMLQAYGVGIAETPLARWSGRDALILGGRILGNLGAQRLGRLFHLRAFRQNPDDASAGYYGARAVAERRGPLAAIAMYRTLGQRDDVPPAVAADWSSFRASLAAEYHDFDTADDLMAEAERLTPDRSWSSIERARVLEKQDRYDDALAAARQSLHGNPWFRAGVQQVAHVLQLLDRDAEALDLLRQGADRLESAGVLMQLATLQDHLHLHADALATCQKLEALVPVVEKSFAQYLAYLRSNIAYHGGDIPAAIEFADKIDTPLMKKVAEQLRKHDGGVGHPRVLIELPFVRQHHHTCAPATLSAISRHWNRPADHLALVDAICYNGTSNYSQRKWARNAGWFTREFAVTWDSAVALIDLGVPFTLATTFVSSGHLQAVIGYDRLRGTLLCRDPYQYYVSEISIELLLEHNAAQGPRGMVMLPPDQVRRVDGLDLPDADLFDRLDEMEQALEVHDRPAAVAARDRLVAAAPDHRLVHQARLTLAGYDGDWAGTLEATDGILATYPQSLATQYLRANALRRLDRRDLLLPMLKQLAADRSCDPVFLKMLADELRRDSGSGPEVMNLLKRSLRRAPTFAQSLIGMAGALWTQRRLDEATELYFMAACVDEKNEQHAESYFLASRHLRRTDHALAMLRRRFDRFGGKSSGPAITLFWALERLDRVPEGFSVLEQARALRPDDGFLLLFCADVYGRRNRLDDAEQMMQLARDKAAPARWLHTAAALSSYRGDRSQSLRLWREVLQQDPTAYDAHEQVARLLAETESPAAAQQHLLAMQQQFPHNTSLQHLRLTWLRSQGASAVAAAAKELLAHRPNDVWMRVERALALLTLGQPAEALDEVDAALAVDPQSCTALNARGQALLSLKRTDDGRAALRRAIELSIDFVAPMHNLVNSYPDADGQREALGFIRQELIRQVIFGDSLLAYRDLASPLLDSIELLDWLTFAKNTRPDLWQTYSVLGSHLCTLNRLDEAQRVAEEAADRFPLLPRVWSDRAHVQGLSGDRAGQVESLERCLQLSPAWSRAARQLATALVHSGDAGRAMRVLEQAIARDQLDGENHAALAKLLWTGGQKPLAIEHARQAVQLSPASTGAWSDLVNWSASLGQEADCVKFCREQTRQRSGEASSWLVLARVLRGADVLDERLAACDAAIAIAPSTEEAYDLKSLLLHEAGRQDEALAACDAPAFGGNAPLILRGRRAWLLMQAGRVEQAIDEMGELLRHNTHYYWGWDQQLQWLRKHRKPEAYRTSAEQMTRSFPHDVVAHNYAAEAQLLCKDQDAALVSLRHALQLSPGNRYALSTLLDEQLKNRLFDEAENTVAQMRQHVPDGFADRHEVKLATARKESARAVAAFTRTLDFASQDPWMVSTTVKAMDSAGMKAVATAALGDYVQSHPQAESSVLNTWAEREVASAKDRVIWKRLKSTPPDSPQWVALANAYANLLAKVKSDVRLTKLIRKYRTPLRANTRTWGTVGYALMTLNKSNHASRWLSDYPNRADAQGWMLFNFAMAERRLGRFREAEAASRAAVAKRSDHSTVKHLYWLALDDAAAGRDPGDLAELKKKWRDKNAPLYTYLFSLTQSLAELQSGDGESPPVKQVRRKLVDAVRRMGRTWSATPEARFAMAAAARRVTAARPTIGLKLWAWWWGFRARFRIR